MVNKYCQRCGYDMPNWETHDICEACDQEFEQSANIEADIAQAEAEAYHKYCYEQSLANSHEGEGE